MLLFKVDVQNIYLVKYSQNQKFQTKCRGFEMREYFIAFIRTTPRDVYFNGAILEYTILVRCQLNNMD